MSKVLLNLPVPTYLKKILVVRYGNDFIAKQNNAFGLTILGALQLKRARNYDLKLESRYTEHFPIWICNDKAVRYGYSFVSKRAYQIAKSMDRQIREELYLSAIVNKNRYEIDYQTTLLDFLDMYDITDEEMSYESLRKDFNRFLYNPRNKDKINKICV